MTEEWPNAGIQYERPDYTLKNRMRWQERIDANLKSGKLRVAPSGHEDYYELKGECPRCGHSMNITLEFNVIRGRSWEQELGRFNVDCNCGHAHKEEKGEGCGWGGPLPSEIPRPEKSA